MGDPVFKMNTQGATPAVQETWGEAPRQPPPSFEEPKREPSTADPFRLGWRYRRRSGSDEPAPGEMVPLSAEDLLYPQEGDVVSDGLPHFLFLQPLVDALRRFLEKRPATHVTSSDAYRTRVYADAEDGWYRADGGTLWAALVAGVSMGPADLTLRVGMPRTLDFEAPAIPFFAQLVANYSMF